MRLDLKHAIEANHCSEKDDVVKRRVMNKLRMAAKDLLQSHVSDRVTNAGVS